MTPLALMLNRDAAERVDRLAALAVSGVDDRPDGTFPNVWPAAPIGSGGPHPVGAPTFADMTPRTVAALAAARSVASNATAFGPLHRLAWSTLDVLDQLVDATPTSVDPDRHALAADPYAAAWLDALDALDDHSVRTFAYAEAMALVADATAPTVDDHADGCELLHGVATLADAIDRSAYVIADALAATIGHAITTAADVGGELVDPDERQALADTDDYPAQPIVTYAAAVLAAAVDAARGDA